ncbi:MAG: hypothetical protein HHJ17_02840 [Rhodoferax sp.]|uniref:hypothetical protein n=1 Tax=Rhodoferax sp. TaxID=50421 RepID=UPI0017C063B2|nr:hypothetical protein [Rhodoferax sp.]NMM12467.1 hypothetical protein [Rhodoferax sp.]
MTNNAKNILQTNLQELQQKIDLIKIKKRAASTLKIELENKINDLYAKPLNDRQMMQFMLSAVDERAAVYKADMLSSGFLDASKIMTKSPLSFDDFEQIQGRGRVWGKRSSPSEVDLLYKFELVKTYNIGTHTWMPYFFGDLIKQKIADLYHCKYGKTALEALESVEDRSAAINDIESQLIKLDEEIVTINGEIVAASEPIMKFMQGFREANGSPLNSASIGVR